MRPVRPGGPLRSSRSSREAPEVPSPARAGAARPPLALAPLAVAGAAFLLLPLVGLLWRTPWSRLGALLTTEVAIDALRLSLWTSVTATAMALVLGVPLAWVLARTELPGRTLLRALVTLPMVLPPVVGGAALLFALGRQGLVGRWLDQQLGVVLAFSPAGVVVTQAFVAMPFLVVTVEAALRSADRRYEEAATTLGAGPWTVFRRVTVPLAAPAVLAGTVLCWARALGEFGATITFAGNLPGRTQTMPLAVFLALETDRGAALALSLVLVATSLAVLVALRDRWLALR
ncbi:MAG: ABC transporter permease [Acidimicrobiales bacterium]